MKGCIALCAVMVAIFMGTATAQQSSGSVVSGDIDLTGKRLFVDLTTHQIHRRLHFITFIMRNFVEMCERGVNVSVYIHTIKDMAERMPHPLPMGMFYCNQIAAILPVTWLLFPMQGTTLAGKHRITWAKYYDDYDYFLHLEDDIDFKWAHLQNYVNEYTRLSKSKYVPYFPVVEYDVNCTTKQCNPDVPHGRVIISPAAPFPMHVFGFRERTYISQEWHSSAHFFATKEFLEPFIHDPSWISPPGLDPLGSYVEHFSGSWLPPAGFTKVYPLESTPQVFVHHMPNKYLGRDDRTMNFYAMLQGIGYTLVDGQVRNTGSMLSPECLRSHTITVDRNRTSGQTHLRHPQRCA